MQPQLTVDIDRQILFFTLPFLEVHTIKPVRNIITFAVDEQQLRLPAPTQNEILGYSTVADPVDLCAIKRGGIAMFTLKDRLLYSRVCAFTSGIVHELIQLLRTSLCRKA